MTKVKMTTPLVEMDGGNHNFILIAIKVYVMYNIAIK